MFVLLKKRRKAQVRSVKEEKKSNHGEREGKELSGKWCFLLWTYLCYNDENIPGGQRLQFFAWCSLKSALPGTVVHGI